MRLTHVRCSPGADARARLSVSIPLSLLAVHLSTQESSPPAVSSPSALRLSCLTACAGLAARTPIFLPVAVPRTQQVLSECSLVLGVEGQWVPLCAASKEKEHRRGGGRPQKQGVDSSAPPAGPIILSNWNTLREKREVMPGPQVKTPLSGEPWIGSPAKREHHCLLETVF